MQGPTGFSGVQILRNSGHSLGAIMPRKMCIRDRHVGLASEEGAGTRVILTFPHDRTRKELFGA